ncbi:MAG: hypothetical protein EHM46_04615, partial [Bacteroidetes bacterium]
MIRNMYTSLIFLTAVFICNIRIYSQSTEVTHLDIRMELLTAGGSVRCSVTVSGPLENEFLLNSDMVISSLDADGKAIPFSSEKRDGNITRISFERGTAGTLEIIYSGKIDGTSYPKVIGVVNRIEPGFAEMAGYVRWYPWFSRGYFTYSVQVVPDEELTVVTNGIRQSGTGGGTRWVSGGPVSDIALVAASGLMKKSSARGDLDLEIYYRELPGSYIDSML